MAGVQICLVFGQPGRCLVAAKLQVKKSVWRLELPVDGELVNPSALLAINPRECCASTNFLQGDFGTTSAAAFGCLPKGHSHMPAVGSFRICRRSGTIAKASGVATPG